MAKEAVLEVKREVLTPAEGRGGDGEDDGESELRRLIVPTSRDLPFSPPSAVETNFVTYFAVDFMKPGHDQYIHRHANGLCVIGLASSHVALKEEGGVTAVDFNVGKSDRSEMKVSGKRKRNALHLEPNSALCKVSTISDSYVVRCCVKGSLLEVNERLIRQPELLNSSVPGSEPGSDTMKKIRELGQKRRGNEEVRLSQWAETVSEYLQWADLAWTRPT